jgi:ATP-dependent Clp protease protease subunit
MIFEKKKRTFIKSVFLLFFLFFFQAKYERQSPIHSLPFLIMPLGDGLARKCKADDEDPDADAAPGGDCIWHDALRGEVYFYAAVTNANVQKLVQTLREALAARRAEAALAADAYTWPRSITLRINSPGGCLYAGLAAHTLLRQMAEDIWLVVDGLCASAATLIALAFPFERRWVSPMAVMVIHEIREDMPEQTIRYSTFKDMSLANAKMNMLFNSIYAARTSIGAQDLARMMEHETVLTLSDIVGHGIAQALVLPP